MTNPSSDGPKGPGTPSDTQDIRYPACTFDPRCLLARFFDRPEHTARGEAEATALAWLISLPGDIDPAIAARDRAWFHRRSVQPRAQDVDTSGGRLLALLDEIAQYPATRLSHVTSRSRGAPRAGRTMRAQKRPWAMSEKIFNA